MNFILIIGWIALVAVSAKATKIALKKFDLL
jgi:hypothetical protein